MTRRPARRRSEPRPPGGRPGRGVGVRLDVDGTVAAGQLDAVHVHRLPVASVSRPGADRVRGRPRQPRRRTRRAPADPGDVPMPAGNAVPSWSIRRRAGRHDAIPLRRIVPPQPVQPLLIQAGSRLSAFVTCKCSVSASATRSSTWASAVPVLVRARSSQASNTDQAGGGEGGGRRRVRADGRPYVERLVFRGAEPDAGRLRRFEGVQSSRSRNRLRNGGSGERHHRSRQEVGDRIVVNCRPAGSSPHSYRIGR